MEIRNQTPLKMPKIIGRKPNYTQEYMMMVGKQVTEGGMTLREAAKTFGMSHGSVSVCKARFKKGDWGHCNAAKVKQANERTQIQRLESSLRACLKSIWNHDLISECNGKHMTQT